MPDTNGASVRPYSVGDRGAVLDVLVESFVGFPPLAVMVGTDDGARDRLARMLALLIDDPRSGTMVAEVDDRVVGALMYADLPDCHAMSPGLMLRLMRIAGKRILSTIRMLSKVEKFHPESPHRHLPAVGIDPSSQGNGIGGALMDEFGRGCDEAGLSGYLETIRWADRSRPSHERFYERYGFVLADESPETHEWSLLTMSRPLAERPPSAPATSGG